MERIDKKIAENHQRQDFLRKRMQSDKEELAKLGFEFPDAKANFLATALPPW